MSWFSCQFTLDNAQFRDEDDDTVNLDAVADQLILVAESIRRKYVDVRQSSTHNFWDKNGNTIGRWTLNP